MDRIWKFRDGSTVTYTTLEVCKCGCGGGVFKADGENAKVALTALDKTIPIIDLFLHGDAKEKELFKLMDVAIETLQ